MSQKQEVTINIFIDFHTDDESIAKGLLTHLSALKYQFNIKIWHHGMIRAGQRRDVLQAAALGEADIILLLMSAAYLNADNFKTYEKEFSRLSQSGAATLIPILAKTSMWIYTDIGRLGLQALPKDGTAIISSHNKSQVYTDIVQELIPVVAHKTEEKPQQQAKFAKELKEKIELTKKEKGFDKEKPENISESKEKASFQDYIRDLIAKNEVKEAFEEIDKMLKYSNDEKLKGYFALFKSRYYRAESDMMIGRITSENMYVEQTRTLEALMASLDKIPEGISQQGAEGSAIYLDSIIKVSEDKPKDSITNNGEGNTNFQGTTINGDVNIDMSSKNSSNKEQEEKVLMYVSSCPTTNNRDFPSLRFGQEEKNIRNALYENKSITINADNKEVERNKFSKIFNNEISNYIHIATHANEKGIILQDKYGNPQCYTTKMLQRLFKKLHDKKQNIEFIFLASCASSQHAKCIAEYVPYVLGMKVPFLDSYLLKFIESFYSFFCTDTDDIEYVFEQTCDMFENGGNICPELFINTNLIPNYNKKETYKNNNQIFYI
ncbi:MAG: hypothetical protein ACPG5B_13470 [Chitinophagales bacterium]